MKQAVDQMKSAQSRGQLDIQRVSDTHQKILVCDRAYGIVGSFNWLSYRGELDAQYRNETSIVVHEPASVEDLVRIAMRDWPGH